MDLCPCCTEGCDTGDGGDEIPASSTRGNVVACLALLLVSTAAVHRRRLSAR